MSLVSAGAVIPAPDLGSTVFSKEKLDKELWQGEVLTNVVQYTYDSIDEGVDRIVHAYAVVMCQDCDLLQDYNKRIAGEEGELVSILLYEADEAATIRAKVATSEIARRVKENREERFHYIEEVPAADDLLGIGIPALTIDFKRFFTISPKELYRQIERHGEAERRSRLETPYKEHLQTRAAVYTGRVGLPRPHRRI